METNRLRQFCAIVETGSLVKASELLHITHSALSKSMKLLQEEAGLLLLRPAGRGVQPTEQGLLIYQRAKIFLEEEHRIFNLDENLTALNTRIGAAAIFLQTVDVFFKTNLLENNITLLDLDPEKMERMIANHQLDYGITYAPFPEEKVEIIEVGKYRLGCYFLKGTFENKPISDIPFVVPAQSLSTNTLDIKERDGWIDSIYPRNKKYFVNLLSVAIELTLKSKCAIYIPDFIARKVNETQPAKKVLVEYPLHKMKKNLQRVFLLKHKDRKEDRVFKELHKVVKEMIS